MKGPEAIAEIAKHAVACEVATLAPAELITAQAILEAGWNLEHAPGFNCFGIKALPHDHERQLLSTTEWFTDAEVAQFMARGDGRTAKLSVGVGPLPSGRRLYSVLDWFRAFPTLEACFRERAALVTRGGYRQAFIDYQTDKDLEKYVRSVARVYATDPKYADKVLQIMAMPEVTAALAAARAERTR